MVRESEPMSAEENDAVVLAIDIGGTKLAAGLVDERGTLRRQVTVPTPATPDAEALFAVLADLVEELRGHLPSCAPRLCGVGCGGPMTAGGELVSPLNIEAWRDFPLRSRLAGLTGLPTFVDNDAKALALAEGWRGAAVGSSNYIALVVSTGIGGGCVVDGRVLDGATGNAGHIGHVIVVPRGRRCACGARGCLEAEASGTAIAAITGRSAAEATPEVVQRTARLVGQAVGSVANLLDIRLAVVAGSVALGFGEPFFAAAQEELDRTACLDFSRRATIRPAGLGGEGPLIGAAAVGLRGISQHPIEQG